MTRRKRDPPPPREVRDRAAERALFEEALRNLDPAAPDELELLKHLDPANRDRPNDADSQGESIPEWRARFSKRVTRGEVEPAAVLDLHGLDRATAADRVRRFLSAARGEAVLVIHGKGLGIVEAAVLDELDRHPRVVEHLRAPPGLGGAGARLVRLRRA